jgi:hypothetical protein
LEEERAAWRQQEELKRQKEAEEAKRRQEELDREIYEVCGVIDLCRMLMLH